MAGVLFVEVIYACVVGLYPEVLDEYGFFVVNFCGCGIVDGSI